MNKCANLENVSVGSVMLNIFFDLLHNSVVLLN